MASKQRTQMVADNGPKTNEAVRSVLSLLLVIHLFCIFMAVGTVLPTAPLHRRLVYILAPYVQLLNFDVDSTPYYLTHNTNLDVDHRIELLPRGADRSVADNWAVLPDVGFRGGERYRRFQRLAHVMAYFTQTDQEAIPAIIAKAVVQSYLSHTGAAPAYVRCRGHLPIERDWVTRGTAAQRDPNDEMHFTVVYGALVTVTDGEVDVTADASASEVASPATDPTSADSPSQ